jgi:hypothetical protein
MILLAQKGTVRGNVFDKETAQPIGFATVQIDGTNIGASTDINGFFSVANVPAGEHKLVANFVGYESVSADIVIKKSEIIFQNIYMVPSNKLSEIVINGKKTQAQSQVQISKLTVTPKQIRSLPSAGGQSDIAQYLTVLPGVIFTGDQGGQLYIRGGSPVQNKILLDGMTIYNPFHSIGFFSVFETELIRSVDVLTGGFNADYGGRISAVVDVKTREGNRKRLSGLASASPFLAKALIEGPIVPLSSDNGSSISFVLTAKQGLINQTAKQLYKYVNDSVGIPFDFRDIYGKLSLLTGNGSKMNVFGFKYTDGVHFPDVNFAWNSSGGGLDFTLIPTNSSTIVDGKFTYSGYNSSINEVDRKNRTSGISNYFGNLNFTDYDRNSEIKYGLELNGFHTTFQYVNALNLTLPSQDDNSTEINAYVRWKYKAGPLVIEPGFRLQYYQSLSTVSPEPRLGVKYNLSNNLRFKAAAGYYTQNLLSTVNERDIVNLFIGFLSSPDQAILKPGSKTDVIGDKLQKSYHGVLGFEYDFTDNFDINIEGYYKKFNQLISLNRFKTKPEDSDYFVETGDAKGIDVSLKYEGKRAYIWAAYSLGFVSRNDGTQIYPPVFDRRHNLNLVTSYAAGKKRQWELGARWNFGSGFPFTLSQGFYSNFTFSHGISTDVNGGNPDLGILYSDQRNSGRLPYYHRLDLSVKRLFDISKYVKLEVTASATNVYDRPNIFYFDRVRYNRVNQLPILPSLSATFQF